VASVRSEIMTIWQCDSIPQWDRMVTARVAHFHTRSANVEFGLPNRLCFYLHVGLLRRMLQSTLVRQPRGSTTLLKSMCVHPVIIIIIIIIIIIMVVAQKYKEEATKFVRQ